MTEVSKKTNDSYTAVFSLEYDILAFAGCIALGLSWSFWTLIAPCLVCFSSVSVVCLYFLSLASVCLWECTERWLMGKINTCLWAESSPCFLRCLWFSELFVCCLQTTSGVCLCCEHRLLLKQSQHMIRLERLYFTGESQVTKRSDSCLSSCASRI